MQSIVGLPLDAPAAVEALSALAHPTRLALFRLLVRAGTAGMPAGEIADEIGALRNTLSTHLAVLSRAGLIDARRMGRSIVYSADYARMRALLEFLVDDCCAGRPDICGALLPALDCASS